MIRTFPLHGAISLDCRTGFGTVNIHAGDAVTEATVELTQRDPSSDIAARTQVDLRGHTLVVHGPKPRGTLFDIPVFAGRFAERDGLDVDITVPAGTRMRIASWGADVTVDGRAGTLDVSSGSTATDVAEVDGDLRLRCGSGPIRVERVGGSATVRSGSGDAQFGEVGGRLDMTCGSGNLEVQLARGPVQLRTGSGAASIGAAYGDVALISGSGGLSIGLPAGQAARLDVVTGSGRLNSELPVESRSPGGPAITIRARTGSGDVRLFRAQQLDRSA